MSYSGILISLLLCLIAQTGNAQTIPEKDLITLHNGNQLLGYIIEQHPGESISIFRPELKDTVKVSLEDVYKITRINVLIIPAASTSTKIDSPASGKRYNYKRNVVQFGYQRVQSKELAPITLQGINLGYFRNLNNRFYIGIQSSYLFWNITATNRQLDTYTNVNFHRIQVLAEGKIRLFGSKIQHSRFSFLGIVNAGMTVDLSSYETSRNPAEPMAPKFIYENGFTAQTLLAVKINPDKNSGFMFEPGITWYHSRVSAYNGNGVFVQKTGSLHYQPTIRFHYFF